MGNMGTVLFWHLQKFVCITFQFFWIKHIPKYTVNISDLIAYVLNLKY